MPPRSSRRPRNPVARAVRTPQYRPRISGDKRRKILEESAREEAFKIPDPKKTEDV